MDHFRSDSFVHRDRHAERTSSRDEDSTKSFRRSSHGRQFVQGSVSAVPLAADSQQTTGLPAIEDEEIAARSATAVLITAATLGKVETLARRIHGASARAAFPFVQLSGSDLPGDLRMLTATCSELLAAAAGGSILITNVEELAPVVQDLWLGLFASPQLGRAPGTAARLMAGTTVSLLDRVAAGQFSERLFYRLNVIHLVVAADAPEVTA